MVAFPIFPAAPDQVLIELAPAGIAVRLGIAVARRGRPAVPCETSKIKMLNNSKTCR